MSKHGLKVLFYTDPTAFQMFGGAEIQMLKTKEYVERISRTEIKFFDLFEDKLGDYDLLHCFKLRDECLSLCRLAKLKGLRIAISSIYTRWNPLFETKTRSQLENATNRIGLLFSNLRRYNSVSLEQLFPFKDLLEISDVIMPTSRMEADLLSKRFKIDRKKFVPVPIGVESSFSQSNPKLFIDKYGLSNFVLFVGRIERRKNVLTVIKACIRRGQGPCFAEWVGVAWHVCYGSWPSWLQHRDYTRRLN
jgi:glycosyltransferase involved in cell wall biosynthesis